MKNILHPLLGVLFLLLGLSHFYYTVEMAVFVPLPHFSKWFVYLIGTIISVSSVLIILQRKVLLSFILIAMSIAISGALVQLGIELNTQDEILKPVGVTNIIKLLISVLILLLLLLFKEKINSKKND